ncbi:FAD-binding oxidoreductase [Maribacter arcticus]|uniref:FAD-binding oxidoreductase n=1 Tax=Maribacter arcticus TaxID=561365 RepID=UPI0030DBE8EE
MKIRLTPREAYKKQMVADLIAIDKEQGLPADYPFTIKELIEFEQKIQGKIVYPWSPGYENDKKEFNDVYPAFPKLIVYVANYNDIGICLMEARNRKIDTVIRSGGHSLADYSVCDGLVVDISNLKSFHVDKANKTLWVQAGITFEELNPQLEFFNLHLPGGGCPSVSIAGYMQGGGYGLTSRNFGIESDCVLAFTMMLADGTILTASASENIDLFWAVRGGTGGNFGVLLDITYKVFDLDLVWGIALEWEIETDETYGAQALHAIQENYLTGNQHPNLGIETIVYTDIPNGSRKKVRFGGCYNGDKAGLEAAVEPLKAIPGVTQVYCLQAKYSVVNNNVLEGIPAIPSNQLPSLKFYGRSAYVSRSLSIDDYKNILTYFNTVPNTFGMLDLEGYGGVINQYPVEDSAFIHRDALFNFYTIAFFDDVTNDQEANRIWINDFYKFLEQYTDGYSNQNYPNRDQTDFQYAYWGIYYHQLVAIKNKYDPNNFFNYQQSIGAPISVELAAKQVMLFDKNT